jgi:hypothetical protein
MKLRLRDFYILYSLLTIAVPQSTILAQDVEDSECYLVDDKLSISFAIQSYWGFNEFNHQVGIYSTLSSQFILIFNNLCCNAIAQ